MALSDFVFFKASFEKVIIHIARKNEVISVHVLLGYLKQISEPLMRLCTLVNIKSMAVKEPKFVRVISEKAWVRRILKGHFCFAEVRIFAPETLQTLECWQSRVYTNARTCCDE